MIDTLKCLLACLFLFLFGYFHLIFVHLYVNKYVFHVFRANNEFHVKLALFGAFWSCSCGRGRERAAAVSDTVQKHHQPVHKTSNRFITHGKGVTDQETNRSVGESHQPVQRAHQPVGRTYQSVHQKKLTRYIHQETNQPVRETLQPVHRDYQPVGRPFQPVH